MMRVIYQSLQSMYVVVCNILQANKHNKGVVCSHKMYKTNKILSRSIILILLVVDN